MKKILFLLMAVLVFATPISAFASNNHSDYERPKIGEVKTFDVGPEGSDGSFVGIPTINKVESQAALSNTTVSAKAAYWGTITTKATGYTNSLDLDWQATFNDYISGGILTADLYKWEAGRGWYLDGMHTEEYIYSSSLKNPRGQFTFNNLKSGKYKVVVYGEFIGRNTTFMMLEVPESNETWVGVL
ncbi:hypothetical protein [Niallia sp. FSL R7-0271]|uniref:hypothetical protein n=1 Tax=Niallia sp. FSL R7-0271 TaxID=2921678 RepID=UPI0030FB9493